MRMMRFLLIVGLVVVVSACGRSSATPESTLPPALVELMADAEGLTAEILADGVVTLAEVERAVLAYRACLDERGVDVAEFEYDPWALGGSLSVTIRGVTSEAVMSADELDTMCFLENLDPVTLAHWYMMPDSEREQIAAFEEGVIECARDLGFVVETADEAVLLFDDEQAELCSERAAPVP